MLRTIDNKVGIKDVVAKQLPEFVRENYPTFVAFVEAYYEFMQNNEIRLDQVRDVDLTLEKFLQYFKKELAISFPGNLSNERFLLSHVKDEYLAKGSEASYRLLFRLLYGKEIYMEYPGRSMLRVSDGRWKQDISLFVRVSIGDPNNIIGKTIDVQTSRKIYRSSVSPTTLKLTKVSANVESARLIDKDKNIWEIFIDRNFYGQIAAGDIVTFSSEFQGLVLPTTSKVSIQNRGQGFKPGQVFQVASGGGTPIWFKITAVEDDAYNNIKGMIKTLDIIRFAYGYDTDFSITVLPTSAVTSGKTIQKQTSTITYSKINGTIGKIDVLSGGADYTLPPQVIIGGTGTGATAHAVLGTGDEAGQVVEIVMDSLGEGYTTSFANLVNAVGDTTGFGATAETVIGTSYSYNTKDKTTGFNELGYINYGDYWSSDFSDGAYVGTIVRQFYLDAKDTISGNAALLNVTLDALARYPGYYKSNEGFLNDAMYIQDSYYYQGFSYVIRIDEQLQSYAAAVRSMLHPSGMALFGEYSINNKFDLSVALEVFIKSLGVTIYDEVFANDDSRVFTFSKDLSTVTNILNDSLIVFNFSKSLSDSFSNTDLTTLLTTKLLAETITKTDATTLEFTKRLDEIITESEVWTHVTSKLLEETPIVTEYFTHETAKYVTDGTIGVLTDSGYITKNPYDTGGYFLEIYANPYESTF